MPPHATHFFEVVSHDAPAAQLVPPQQGCVVAPHATHVPALHSRPEEHVLPTQQSAPAVPHDEAF